MAVPGSNGAPVSKLPGTVPVVRVGGEDQLPQADDVLKNLRHPEQNVHAIIAAGEPGERAACLQTIAGRLRTRYLERGRPHVVIFPSLSELAEMGVSPKELLSGFESVILPVTEGTHSGGIFPETAPRTCCDAVRWLDKRKRTLTT